MSKDVLSDVYVVTVNHNGETIKRLLSKKEEVRVNTEIHRRKRKRV
jgi:ribosome-associated protein YbcJ (S4-like RNA binding protein)